MNRSKGLRIMNRAPIQDGTGRVLLMDHRGRYYYGPAEILGELHMSQSRVVAKGNFRRVNPNVYYPSEDYYNERADLQAVKTHLEKNNLKPASSPGLSTAEVVEELRRRGIVI